MSNFIDLIDLMIVTAGITVSVLGLMLSCRVQFMDRWLKSFFTVLFAVLIAYTLSDLLSQISLVMLGEDFAPLSRIGVFLESFFSSLLMPALSMLLLHSCGEDEKGRLFVISIILWGVYIMILIITQFTTFIYTVTPDNVYRRGPMYPLLLLPAMFLMLNNLAGLFLRRKRLSKRETVSFLAYILIPLLSMLIQSFVYGILMIILGTTIAVLIMFVLIMNEQVEKNIRQAREVADQQLKIRTLQMRPHFIYNTMSNIYYLCEREPKKAQKVVEDFNKYLHKNFSAVTKHELIPFSDELEHTRAYLAVVKARYERLLEVEYDTEYVSFKLPPLTLEPIAENAVKHGIDPELPALHVLIRTEKTDGGARVIVEDSGPGFSEEVTSQRPGSSDDDVHIGLENVRERLRALCGGTLSISPRDGGGSKVVIFIPF